ncbi:MAG: tetratricopeptide repeat protein [Gemmatimonadetes bacterium]|nr:tetratricopeptide repeat protein [Gemmatimonadota bacterium]
MLRRLLPLLGLLLLGGCATKRDVRDIGENMQELYAQQQASVRDVQRDQRALQDTVGMLLRELQDGRAETARRMANVEDLLLLLQELQGVSQQQIAGLRDQIERDRRQVVSFGTGIEPGAQGSSSSASDLYQAGVTAFRRGLYSSARVAFQDILELHANDPLAAEARFYMADILVEEGETQQAIDAFLEIPTYHPTAEKVPEAHYRAALLYLELGNREEAERHLDLVVNTWPEDGIAELARSALRDLR